VPRSQLAKVTLLFIACLTLFSIANVFTIPLMSGSRNTAILLLICFGAIGAQAGLVSLWFVFAPIRTTTRMLTGIAATLVLFEAWAIGETNYRLFFFYLHDDVTTAFLWLPLLLLAVQMPMWAAKYWFRWRIVNWTHSARRQASRSMGIRDLMIGTGATAICLALAKHASDGEGDEAFIGLAIAMPVVVLISSLTTIPATAATLRSRRLCVALPWILLTNATVVAAYIATVFGLVDRQFPPASVYREAYALVVSFTVCLTGPLLIARWLGYRLRWGRQ